MIGRESGAIFKRGDAGPFGAVGAAENFSITFYAVANDLGPAFWTLWGEQVNRALE